MSVGWSIFSRSRRINASRRRWHPSRYPIKRLNDWIRPLMYIFSRGRIQTQLVSDWLHRELEIYRDMSPLLTTWPASSSAQNTWPRQPFRAFRRWSWHVWDLLLSIIRCLWIPLPRMRWRPPRFIVGGMRKSPGLIQPRETQTFHVPTFQW